MHKIRVVVGSRASREAFFETTATGRSLRLYASAQLELQLFADNKKGLPALYNAAIEGARNNPCMLVFMHDDVHLLDYFWADQLAAALQRFQLVGLAGNKRRVPRQPGWGFVDTRFTLDDAANFSGVVGHGRGFPPERLLYFGPPGQQVKLLDGLLLCGWSSTFIERDLRFDERFEFHFYDMDLCRSAERKGVSCGTCALSVVHESTGSFGTPAWQAAYARYLEKWGD